MEEEYQVLLVVQEVVVLEVVILLELLLLEQQILEAVAVDKDIMVLVVLEEKV